MTLLHAFGMLLIVATVLLTLAALAGLAGTLSSRQPGAALAIGGGLAAWYALVVGAHQIGHRAVFSLLPIICCVLASTQVEAEAVPCQGGAIDSIALTVQFANSGNAAFNGRSLAQTFVASDSLLSSVTVWRAADPNAHINPMHLYLCGVDSTGRPDTQNILLDGPTIVCACQGNEPMPVRFELSTPLGLVRSHSYCFAIKEDSDNCFGGFGLAVDSLDDFANGSAWEIHATPNCHGLGLSTFELQGNDLAFVLEFCSDAVPTRSGTWGRAKEMYR